MKLENIERAQDIVDQIKDIDRALCTARLNQGATIKISCRTDGFYFESEAAALLLSYAISIMNDKKKELLMELETL